MTTTERATELLTEDMLGRFDERAPVYDRENRFFQEDFDELVASGYLNAALPTEMGGAGLTLSEVNRLQRRLAYSAPGHGAGGEHAPLLGRPGGRPAADGRPGR